MHGKMLVVSAGITVLEGLAQFSGDVQVLGTFFLDFSHQGVLG
jgi:hypothetical protein